MQILVVLVLAGMVGMLIELVQGNIGRTSEVKDICRDLLGVLVAMTFLVPSRYAVSLQLRRVCKVFVIVLILLEAYPLAKSYCR